MLVDLSSDDGHLHPLSRELRTICQAMGSDHRQGIEALGTLLARLKRFVENMPNRGSFGMLGMRERAQLWDSDVTVCSRPGSGTTVTVYMPYQQEEDA